MTDQVTLRNPTTRTPRPGSDGADPGPTAERVAWPEHAIVASLLSIGVSYTDAWHMSPLDSLRLLAITSADRIPPTERIDGAVMGTEADARAIFGGAKDF